MADIADRARRATAQVGSSIAAGTGTSAPPPAQKPDAILRPKRKNDKALPPELQQQLDALAAETGITIDPAMLGGGAASDRLALMGITAEVAESPVLIRKGDVSSLGVAPTIGMSNYRGNQTQSMLEVLEDFWEVDRATLIDLQQRLWAGGFFGEGDAPAFGADLSRTFEAYRDAVLLAAQSGKSLMDEVLSPDAEGGPEVEVTNREDIRVLLERVAPEAIGRKLSTEELERAVSAWHARERQPTDGESEMSTETLVDLSLAEAAPGEEEGYSFARNATQFFDLLDSPVA